MAGKLYETAGIDVPEMMIDRENGKIGLASRIINGLEANAAALKGGEISGIADGFGMDAWLANWDVIGLGYDNMLIKGGRAYRVDTGGAMLYRAQGAEKGAAFGKKVTEIKSLRTAAQNSQAASVFATLTDNQVKASVARVLALDEDLIRSTVLAHGPGDLVQKNALADLLLARKKDLAKQFKEVIPKIKPALTAAANAEKARIVSSLTDLDDAIMTAAKGINFRASSGSLLEAKDLARVQDAVSKYELLVSSTKTLSDASLTGLTGHYSAWIDKLKTAILQGEGAKAASLDGIFKGLDKALLVINKAAIKPKFEAWMFGEAALFSGAQVLNILRDVEKAIKRKAYLAEATVPENAAIAKAFNKMPEKIQTRFVELDAKPHL